MDTDCAGVCGGDAVEDECGVCGGPGAIYECGCEELPSNDIVDGCDLPDNTLYITSDGSVQYNSTNAIGGFQFNVDGASVLSVSNGDAISNGFTVSSSASVVIGFSFTGSTIPAGCGTLVELSLEGSVTALSTIIVSDAVGGNIDFTYYESSNELVCDCDGNTIDECGVCGGDGIADGACDCDGNVDLGCGCGEAAAEENFDCDGNCIVDTDCAGVCGGDAIEDECGVCGGDGIADGACDCDGNVDLGCGCGEAAAEENFDCDGNCIVDTDCAGVCGGDAVEDECGVCGGDGIADGTCDCDGNVDLGCGCGEAAAEENFDCDGNCIVDTDCDNFFEQAYVVVML